MGTSSDQPLRFPWSAGGSTSQTVGYFETGHSALAGFLASSDGWERVRECAWTSFPDAQADLSPGGRASVSAVVPIGSWALMLTDGPLGTDVGLVPSIAARHLGCRAIRAVSVDRTDGIHPAQILEVFGPDGRAPLLSRRSIAAANDGGHWVFETSGEPFGFEQVERYTARRKADRFPAEMLFAYLVALGVPVGSDPDWSAALVIDHASN